MEKVLLSISHQLAFRLRALIPVRQRSKVVAHLIENELERRENQLYACAMAVEKDKRLNKEMKDWDVTIKDGLKDESW